MGLMAHWMQIHRIIMRPRRYERLESEFLPGGEGAWGARDPWGDQVGAVE